MHLMQRRDPYLPLLNTAAAFAAGFAATWLIAEAASRRAMRTQNAPLADDVVLERVRARVVEIASEPQSVQVTVENGVVRLSGVLPPEERDQLLTQLVYMPGVVRLRNALATRP